MCFLVFVFVLGVVGWISGGSGWCGVDWGGLRLVVFWGWGGLGWSIGVDWGRLGVVWACFGAVFVIMLIGSGVVLLFVFTSTGGSERLVCFLFACFSGGFLGFFTSTGCSGSLFWFWWVVVYHLHQMQRLVFCFVLVVSYLCRGFLFCWFVVFSVFVVCLVLFICLFVLVSGAAGAVAVVGQVPPPRHSEGTSEEDEWRGAETHRRGRT